MANRFDFSSLKLNTLYDRPELAELWGYKSHQAIDQGVVFPAGQKLLILFVTKDKQKSFTQYEDRIDADLLFWEGEKEHRNDGRIVAGGDEIQVFYRERHHSKFVYKGKALVRSYRLYSDRPSRFTFTLLDLAVDEDILAEPSPDYAGSSTVREALVQSRLGQGQYRRAAIALWESCSVTGFAQAPILIASHVKPWRSSNNQERLDPYNSLLLVPTLDRLFDRGYVGFDRNGRIMLSDRISPEDWKRIAINPEMHLRKVPELTKPFLDYHTQYVFDLV